MIVGDLVKAGGTIKTTGIIVGWKRVDGVSHPLVLWKDGSCCWIPSFRVEVI